MHVLSHGSRNECRGTPYSWVYGKAPPERGAFFKLAVCKRGRENCHFSIRKGHKISCKVEEMVAKAKYIKGCHILAEMTTQRNQNDWKQGKNKNVTITVNSIVFAYS